MSHAIPDVGDTSYGGSNQDFADLMEDEFYDMSELSPLSDLWGYAQEYAREKPEIAALWCFGVGFILGWKLKPW